VKIQTNIFPTFPFNGFAPKTKASCGFKTAIFAHIFSNSYKKLNLFSNKTTWILFVHLVYLWHKLNERIKFMKFYLKID
jgi:hypothetical protein